MEIKKVLWFNGYYYRDKEGDYKKMPRVNKEQEAKDIKRLSDTVIANAKLEKEFDFVTENVLNSFVLDSMGKKELEAIVAYQKAMSFQTSTNKKKG